MSMYIASKELRKTRVDADHPLGPPTCKGQPLRDVKAAINLFPLEELPRFLVPHPKKIYRPPALHYGYPFTKAFITAFAADKGVLAFTDDYDSPRQTNDSHERIVDFGRTLEAVLEFIVKDAGITSFKLSYAAIQVFSSMDRSIFGVMAILSNYPYRNGRSRSATAEDAEKLRTYLKESEGPRWYIDLDDFSWGIRPYFLL